MQKQYVFEDFQLDSTEDIEEVNMDCGIAIPIRSIADLPIDIVEIINHSLSETMEKFEKTYGRINNLSTLRLEVWLQVDEIGLNRHYISLLLFDNVGNDARTNICICPKDDYYLSFANYCASILNRYLFAI